MHTIKPKVAAVLLAIAGGLSPALHADELAEKGRAILEEHKSAIVTMAIVINQKVSFTGASSQSRESKIEATGTVISPEGLTVMSLSETDPSSVMEQMMAAAGQSGNMQMETEVRDIKIMLLDGSEVTAEVILRDKDLDMAFVRPKEKQSTPFAYVKIEDSAAPKHLDPVITINRLGQVAGREHAASVERISAIVTRPRTFYVPGLDPTQTGLGSPAFTVDGKFVGINLLRVVGGGGGGSMLGGRTDNIAGVIIPASDILEGAQQAPKYPE